MSRFRRIGQATVLGMVIGCSSIIAQAAPRDVQFRSVDLSTGVIELHNFGAGDEALDSWQFCTHSDTGAARYTAATGLNGVTVEAGTSFFVHTANDAPADPDHRNLSSLGGFFSLPMDTGPFALELFRPNGPFIIFGSAADMVDHLQWAIGGSSIDALASFRNLQAVSAGLWDDAAVWINTAADSALITLDDTTGGLLHGASDYTVSIAALLGDLNSDGFVGIADLNIVLGAWNQAVPPGDPLADPSGDGFVGIADLNVVLGNWNAGTPPSDSANIPEPGTMGVLGLMGLGLFRRR